MHEAVPGGAPYIDHTLPKSTVTASRISLLMWPMPLLPGAPRPSRRPCCGSRHPGNNNSRVSVPPESAIGNRSAVGCTSTSSDRYVRKPSRSQPRLRSSRERSLAPVQGTRVGRNCHRRAVNQESITSNWARGSRVCIPSFQYSRGRMHARTHTHIYTLHHTAAAAGKCGKINYL